MTRAGWDDPNLPARTATPAAAGFPLLLRDNPEDRVAVQTIARRFGNGIFVRPMQEAAERLSDPAVLGRAYANAWAAREAFTFDRHADRPIEFFRRARGHPPPLTEYPHLCKSRLPAKFELICFSSRT